MKEVPPPTLSRFAAQEYVRRQARAAELVRARALTIDAATVQLRPWLALACLCGAELPELDEPLADYRVTYADGRQRYSEGELRSLAADAICPRRIWRGELTKVRDHALTAASTPGASDIHLARARGLAAMARALIPEIPIAPLTLERTAA